MASNLSSPSLSAQNVSESGAGRVNRSFEIATLNRFINLTNRGDIKNFNVLRNHLNLLSSRDILQLGAVSGKREDVDLLGSGILGL